MRWPHVSRKRILISIAVGFLALSMCALLLLFLWRFIYFAPGTLRPITPPKFAQGEAILVVKNYLIDDLSTLWYHTPSGRPASWSEWQIYEEYWSLPGRLWAADTADKADQLQREKRRLEEYYPWLVTDGAGDGLKFRLITGGYWEAAYIDSGVWEVKLWPTGSFGGTWRVYEETRTVDMVDRRGW